MEVTQLRYFLELSRHLNFSNAAADLGVSQPALSRSIAKLEEELGLPLFERTPAGLVPTDAGERLLARATVIVQMLDDTVAELRDDGQSGRLRIGAIPTIAPYFLPSLLKTFTKQFPHAHLTVQEDVTERLLHQCKAGLVDLAILSLPVNAKHLESMPLCDEELLVVLPAKHPLCKRKTIPLSELDRHPMILLGEHHCLSDQIANYCYERALKPLAVETTSQLATIQELVALGHGISLIPAMARQVDQDPRRCYRSLENPRPIRTIGLVWNPYRHQSRLMQHFREHVLAHSGKGQE